MGTVGVILATVGVILILFGGRKIEFKNKTLATLDGLFWRIRERMWDPFEWKRELFFDGLRGADTVKAILYGIALIVLGVAILLVVNNWL